MNLQVLLSSRTGRASPSQSPTSPKDSRSRGEEMQMMFRRYEKGGGRHEPPYTEEEEFEFYRRISEGIASGKAMIYRSRPAAADKQ